MTRVKICGITSANDAEFAIACGADALGFVFEPSSPRYVDRFAGARELPGVLGPLVTTFAVYGHLKHEPTECRYTQFVEGDSVRVRDAVRVIRYEPGLELNELEWMLGKEAPEPRLLFLDAHEAGVYGGTGKPIDWNWAAEVVCHFPHLRIVLAGGLTPDNVGEAIDTVRPYGVDVSSGVEAQPGIKDHSKVRAFCEAVRNTTAEA